MPDIVTERRVGSLMIRIDRTLCVGFGDCIREGERAFELDEEGVVVFREPEELDRAKLIEACDACPVDALTVVDETGTQIVPA